MKYKEDLTLPINELAKQQNVSYQTIYYQRNKKRLLKASNAYYKKIKCQKKKEKK